MILRIIGVTGPIGSGKSTVTGILSNNYGAKIINADNIYNEIIKAGQKALIELVDCFGSGILDDKGELNRRKLAEIVFKDSEKLKLLNSITHKYVVERIIYEINISRAYSHVQLLGLECPIPVEHGFMDVSDEIWVVTADMETRIKRIMSRNNLSYDEAIDRINSQKTEEEYIRIARHVIYNNGDISMLEEKIKELINKLIG